MDGATEQLMQPSDNAKALCYGDDRFTGKKPDEKTLEKLAAICRDCEMFFECEEWAETFKARDEDDYPVGATEVFAAGGWRE